MCHNNKNNNNTTKRFKVPADQASDATARAAGAHPFLDVSLKPARPVFDVQSHLFRKWARY